jgi:acetolactate synthase-1/2/3 large subunit
VLADGGIEYVLGMPGGYTGPIFSSLHNHPTIRVVQVREESIGSIMADAYGRIAGNAGQGFLEALLESAPIVVLTEMSDGGPLSHHGYEPRPPQILRQPVISRRSTPTPDRGGGRASRLGQT